MDSIVNRIKTYLDEKGIKVSSAETAIGVSNGALATPFNHNKTIKTDTLEKFLSVYDDIDTKWLLTGKKSYNEQEEYIIDQLRETNEMYKLRTDHNIEKQQVPLYNLEATTGLIKLFQNQGDVVPLDHIHIPNLPKCDGAIYVHGDSMVPLLKSGDIILYKIVHNISDGIFWGEMYLVSISFNDDEWITVKWIQKSDKGKNYIKLVSENKQHEFKDVPIKNIRALALIKASIRINTMR